MRVQSREKIHGHAVAPGDIFQPSESTDDKVGYIELLAAQAEEPPSTESEQVPGAERHFGRGPGCCSIPDPIAKDSRTGRREVCSRFVF